MALVTSTAAATSPSGLFWARHPGPDQEPIARAIQYIPAFVAMKGQCTLFLMTNYTHGHEAEKRAAKYLRKQGYKILELNWKHQRAEIDIVARKGHSPLSFVEVKYRETAAQGNGLDYITVTKLKQMAFAADLYIGKHTYSGEYVLAAIELSGPDYDITSFIAEL